jgi:hypothetical protein
LIRQSHYQQTALGCSGYYGQQSLGRERKKSTNRAVDVVGIIVNRSANRALNQVGISVNRALKESGKKSVQSLMRAVNNCDTQVSSILNLRREGPRNRIIHTFA